MAKITLNGGNVTIAEGGSYSDAGATAVADDNTTDVTSALTNNAGSIDTSTPGTQTVTYTLPQNLSGGADEVAVETTTTRTVTVTAAPQAPSNTDDFKAGKVDRYGTQSPNLKRGVTHATDDDDTTNDFKTMQGLFDESGLDPYEAQFAGVKYNH